MTDQLSTKYDPKQIEGKWYDHWLSKRYFHASIEPGAKPFTIVIPPPNVTGSLHMGHALNNTMQDCLVRYFRMRGRPTLWLPGTDHAGIATQNVVEKQLATEGLTRHDLGRERFVERVWKWKEEYGTTIVSQLKRLGCSCDWDRERFTMDEGYTNAVRRVFVDLYDAGLIYRGNRIINWCPRDHTALADIEVEHEEADSHLWHIRYPIKGTGEYLIIATTRPETMLGDTAVAVNPNDSRYTRYVGKSAILPLVGREIPIIADDYVDMQFGTGALKVTPAHDPNDFEIAQRHDIATINVMTPEAKINENGGRYEGMDRYEARKAIVADLEKEGLLEKVAPYVHSVGHCYRCHTTIEPYLSDQWFIDMKPLAQPAIDVVREGKVSFVPDRWSRIYFEWMENIRDWCISRQIWWGHQIPAWYCECGEMVVAPDAPRECPKCSSSNLTQDSDVLDTWFSSALWPFATLGWPERTPDLEYFYPTSVLSTARDILYLWVARMIMMGLKFMGDIPFETVIIHPTVLNFEGRRMSKSLGTGVDPLDLIEKYGTDATRFGILVQTSHVQDMRFTEDKLEMSRNFCNKIWNASRLILMNLESYEPGPPEPVTVSERWILSRYERLVEQATGWMETYQLSDAGRALYDFFWSDFCDWQLELAKAQLYGEDAEAKLRAQRILVHVLEGALRLLHPLMPFISEEIWQRLPSAGESIMVSPWPVSDVSHYDEQAERDMELLKRVITSVRALRAEFHVRPRDKVALRIRSADAGSLRVLLEHSDYIQRLAGVSDVEAVEEKTEHSAMALVEEIELFVPLEGVIDLAQEELRLAKELDSTIKDLEKVERKLANESFLAKAAVQVVDKEKAKRDALGERIGRIASQIEQLKE
ncbi:MAG: valine--tRNA ligase [Actinobacteria bacterium]|nr:MAG: valine--tRNA ligase [Actinomycetota bacterium]